MTKSEYQQLVEFIAPKFEQIDRRFDAVDRRFDAVDRRFDAVDERFEEVDRRFDAVDERFEEVDRRFDAVDKRFDGIESRLSRVEVYAEENRHLIQIVAEGVQANAQKLDAFKAQVTAEFAAVRSEMAEGFDSVRTAISGLEGRVSSLEALHN